MLVPSNDRCLKTRVQYIEKRFSRLALFSVYYTKRTQPRKREREGANKMITWARKKCILSKK